MWRVMYRAVALVFVLLLGACNITPLSPNDGQPSELEVAAAINPEGYIFRPLKVGAGGFITGIDISPDGSLIIVRTDTYGLYRLIQTSTGKVWIQLITDKRVPAADVKPDQGSGVYEVVTAPSNRNRAYMAWQNKVYRSDNKGSTWRLTAAPVVNRDGNYQPWSKDGPKMAIDPRNPDVVLVGAEDYPADPCTASARATLSANGGSSWQTITGIPIGQVDIFRDDQGQIVGCGGGRGINVILFDPTSPALANGRTSVVYASSYKNGIYRSRDGGTTWARIPGGPGYFKRAEVASDGTLYGVSEDQVWRYRNNTWKQILTNYTGGGLVSITADPKNPNRILVIPARGQVFQSLNGGDTFADPILYTISSPKIPWLAATDSAGFLSPGQIKFDPVIPNRVWLAQGGGVLFADITTNATSVAWTFESTGIEQLVGNDVVAPPGGKPVVAAWDFGTFYSDNQNVYRDRQAVSNRFNSTWNLDYMITKGNAGFADGTIFMVGNTSDHRGCCDDGLELQAGYSVDGGKNWTRFASMPRGATRSFDFGFGDIAVNSGDPNNIIWMPSFNNDPYYTLNRGRTWQKVILPGLIQNGKTGSHAALFLNRKVLVADKTTPGTFYLAHAGQDVVANSGGVYRTANGGRTWTKVFTNTTPFWNGGILPFANFNATLKSVPGKAGHLFFTAGGLEGDPDANKLARSINGGQTWTYYNDVKQVRAFGFGKAALGATYPTLFIAGVVRGEWGLWRSTNEGATWRKIGTYPMGSLDVIKAIDGDKQIFGRVYLAFGGSGFGYGFDPDGD